MSEAVVNGSWQVARPALAVKGLEGQGRWVLTDRLKVDGVLFCQAKNGQFWMIFPHDFLQFSTGSAAMNLELVSNIALMITNIFRMIVQRACFLVFPEASRC